MELDHIVFHSNCKAHIDQLKESLQHAGVPYEPSWGKKAKGFRISNIWIGKQYFEIVEIQSDQNLWQPEWSERHRKGERGTYCLFLKCEQSIDEVYRKLVDSGQSPTLPERTTFKWLFGLLEKRLPWRFITLPKIPGTNIELGFIQYDEGAEQKFAPYMVPNGTDVGLSGMSCPVIKSSRAIEAQRWIEQVQSAVGSQLPLTVEAKDSSVALQLTVDSDLKSNFDGVSFSDVSLLPAHSHIRRKGSSEPVDDYFVTET